MGILTSRKYAPRRESSRRLTIASLSALAVVAAGLSGLALLSQNDGESTAGGGDGDEIATAAATAEHPPTDPVESPRSGNGAASTVAGSSVRSTRLLAVSDDPERLVRAEGVECGAGSASIEVSRDGGDVWTQSDTSLLELNGVRQLQFGEGGRIQLAYVDDACALQLARSYVYGGAWEAGQGAGGVWTLRENEDAGEVFIGGSAVETPCTVVDIAGAGQSGVVLCSDSSVSVSEDRGESWSDPLAVSGGQAVTAEDENHIVASLNDEGCVGVSTRSVSSDGILGDPGECFEGNFKPDQIAISVKNGTLYAWAGDRVARSNDAGTTWLK